MDKDVFTHRHAIEYFKHYGVDNTGFVSDDFGYSNLAIVRALQEARSTLITQAIELGEHISDHTVQVLPCVNVEEVDRNECPMAPASGCYWLKSTDPIPNTIKIISVTDILSNQLFEYKKWSQFKYVAYARVNYAKTAKYYTIRDSGEGPFLYVYNDRFLKKISISAIFEDPMKAAAYPNCGVRDINAYCNPLDVDFHTDAKHRDVIMKSALAAILQIRANVPTDMFNDDLKYRTPTP